MFKKLQEAMLRRSAIDHANQHLAHATYADRLSMEISASPHYKGGKVRVLADLKKRAEHHRKQAATIHKDPTGYMKACGEDKKITPPKRRKKK